METGMAGMAGMADNGSLEILIEQARKMAEELRAYRIPPNNIIAGRTYWPPAICDRAAQLIERLVHALKTGGGGGGKTQPLYQIDEFYFIRYKGESADKWTVGQVASFRHDGHAVFYRIGNNVELAEWDLDVGPKVEMPAK